MNEKYLVLERSIERDLQAIERIYQEIDQQTLSATSEAETLIVLAYWLHNLYNAFENIFQNIATTFENNLDDASRWHTQLLQRMRLDVTPVRPAVIDDTAYDALDELRRFRHVFRYSYDFQLDSARLQLVLTKAVELKDIYKLQVEQFLTFVRELRDSN